MRSSYSRRRKVQLGKHRTVLCHSCANLCIQLRERELSPWLVLFVAVVLLVVRKRALRRPG